MKASIVILLTLTGCTLDESAMHELLNELRVNAAGQQPLPLDLKLSNSTRSHALYLAVNGIDTADPLTLHKEKMGQPGYTPEGEQAGKNGVVFFCGWSSDCNAEGALNNLAYGYHGLDIFDPLAVSVGIGSATNASPRRGVWTLDFKSGKRLDLVDVEWPRTVPIKGGWLPELEHNVVEVPQDPAVDCGYELPTGFTLRVSLGWQARELLHTLLWAETTFENGTVSYADENGKPIRNYIEDKCDTYAKTGVIHTYFTIPRKALPPSKSNAYPGRCIRYFWQVEYLDETGVAQTLPPVDFTIGTKSCP